MSDESPPTPVENSDKRATLAIPNWFKVTLIGIFVFFISILYFKDHDHEHLDEGVDVVSESEEVRRPAPDFKLGNISKSSLIGKVSIVSFWATWCAPCLVELPTFNKLINNVQNQDLVVIPINVDDDNQEEFIEQFWKQNNLIFNNFNDKDKSVLKSFQVESLPTTYVVDKKGRIAMTGVGANDWSSQPIQDLIEDLLGESK